MCIISNKQKTKKKSDLQYKAFYVAFKNIYNLYLEHRTKVFFTKRHNNILDQFKFYLNSNCIYNLKKIQISTSLHRIDLTKEHHSNDHSDCYFDFTICSTVTLDDINSQSFINANVASLSPSFFPLKPSGSHFQHLWRRSPISSLSPFRAPQQGLHMYYVLHSFNVTNFLSYATQKLPILVLILAPQR